MIERERPVRPPLVPRWLYLVLAAATLLTIAGIMTAVLLADASMVEVPNVVGISDGEAKARIKQAGLIPEVSEQVFDPAQEGTVLSQEPAAGALIASGSAVKLRVSAGTEEFLLPDVIGLGILVADAQLTAKGLSIRVEPMESDAPTDTVVATNPSPGATVRTGDIVRVFVAARKPTSDVFVPFDLEGHNVVLDPSPVDSGREDPTLNLARRMRALLEASGAKVIVTRSVTSEDVSPVARSTAVTGTVSIIVGLDVRRGAGQGGLIVRAIERRSAPQSYDGAIALAQALSASLTEAGRQARTGEIPGDPVTTSRDAPAVRVTVGSFAVAEDAAALVDPIWADSVARALYRGIGLYLTSETP